MVRDRDDSSTNAGLLLRVSRVPVDEGAWGEFVDRYGPKILAWSRGWGLQQADAEDVTQAVLVKLARSMGRFSYDPSGSFRGWLRTLTHNAWRDWVAEQVARGRSDACADLSSLVARDDLLARLESTFDLELLVEAVHRVRERVAEKTWRAYHLTAIEEQAGSEVAKHLGMSVSSVFKAKSNTLKLIREQVKILDDGPATSPKDS